MECDSLINCTESCAVNAIICLARISIGFEFGSSPVAIAAALLSGSSLATGLFLVSSGFVRANTEAMLAF